MAILFKSNIPSDPTALLPTIQQTDYTPEQLLAEYTALVELDGGEVIDPVKTLAIITYMQQDGLFGRCAVSAFSFAGVKCDKTDPDNWLAQKIYSIDRTGSDLLGKVSNSGAGGVLPSLIEDTNGTRAVQAEMLTSPVRGGYLESDPFVLAVSRTREAGIVTCQYDVDGATMTTGFGNEPLASSGNAPITLGRAPTSGSNQTNFTAQMDGYDYAAPADNDLRMTGSGARGSSDILGTGVSLNIDAGRATLFNNGVIINQSYSTVESGKLFDYTSRAWRLRPFTAHNGSTNLLAPRAGVWYGAIVNRQSSIESMAALSAKFTEWCGA